jgi:hypothetical protein
MVGVRVRAGRAYLAGTACAADLLGTSGALQRGIAGGCDFFVIAMAQDGSAPVFVTAFGGSGAQHLNDVTLDDSGNIVLVGTSDSQDLPVTPDALSYGPPSSGNPEGLISPD